MEKEEILAKAKEENKGKDVADLDAQRKGAYIGYSTGIILIFIVDLVNWMVFGEVNQGANFAICTMIFVAFLTKFIIVKKKHELIVTICYGVLSLSFLITWIFQLCGVI